MNKNLIAKPTPQQLLWQEQELGVLIHYIMDIYAPDLDPKDIKTAKVRTALSPDKITPTDLDVEQWVHAAALTGARYAVLVANHCSGFSLWQTKANDYCTRSLKWKNGKGDIVKDFIDACKKYNLKPGLYYSTAVNGYYDISDEVPHDYKAPYYREYVKIVEAQITELWSQYGELFEIWFDGGIIPLEKGGPDLEPILRKHQPNALCFGGPKGYINNLRWVGNEDGLAPENCWATTNENDNCGGSFYGSIYCPAETDTPNRSASAFGGGWAWKKNEKHFVRSPEELLDCYIKSVGRNSNLLLGMAIGTSGKFEDEAQFADFGKLLKETFLHPVATTGNNFLTENKKYILKIPKDKTGKYIVIRENIEKGQHIKGFRVFIDNKLIYKGECIGHKRIIPYNIHPDSDITIEITDAVDGWSLKDITIY